MAGYNTQHTVYLLSLLAKFLTKKVLLFRINVSKMFLRHTKSSWEVENREVKWFQAKFQCFSTEYCIQMHISGFHTIWTWTFPTCKDHRRLDYFVLCQFSIVAINARAAAGESCATNKRSSMFQLQICRLGNLLLQPSSHPNFYFCVQEPCLV